MASIRRLTVLCLATLTTPSSATSIPNTPVNEFGPSKAAARHNAFDIFNAIHSAMRQWGSSLNHNGMSLFVVTVPPGGMELAGVVGRPDPDGVGGVGGVWDVDARRGVMFGYVGAEVVKARAGGEGRVVDWQGVVDLIVDRYADRLRYMAEGVESVVWMRSAVNGLLNTHIDYSVEDEGYQAALERCAQFYTRVVVPDTQEDHLILAAVETVTHSICSTLFAVRKLVVEDVHADEGSMVASKQALRALTTKLKWTKWKECAACKVDEVCFVPMWPFGDKASYERPNCRNATSLDNGWWDSDTQYWHPIPKMMPPPDYET
ncbi:uncharacterized protein B0H64DRAFT_345239 [Chaetomium fimeti]|uniref:Uncharacterized protein n=1 Tax=Chaetomium fimeti TaxID=1854472 RepID=A0AAE0HAP4_9PEZI|nr:hypothetical protein B0H64DRAFT_345239 [Chaetomium fimeti]